jgi:hypothetical protein
MGFTELKEALEVKDLQINTLKVESLNLKRDKLRLANKNSDFKRMVAFIATNDIPRLNAIFQVCKRKQMSTDAILMQCQKAVERTYTCKSYT